MPYHEFFWTKRAIRKIGEHGLTTRDVEFVVLKTKRAPVVSKSSGDPAYIGRTPSGEMIFVVFQYIDAVQIMVVTAYPIDN
jgi:uncharacterized DUF497 family protein